MIRRSPIFSLCVFRAIIHIHVSLTEYPAHARKVSADLLTTAAREYISSATEQGFQIQVAQSIK